MPSFTIRKYMVLFVLCIGFSKLTFAQDSSTGKQTTPSHHNVEERIKQTRKDNTGLFERQEALVLNTLVGAGEFIVGGAGTYLGGKTLLQNSKVFYSLDDFKNGRATAGISFLKFGLTPNESELIANKYFSTIKPPENKTMLNIVAEAFTRRNSAEKEFSAGKSIQVEFNNTRLVGLTGIDSSLVRDLLAKSTDLLPNFAMNAIRGLSREDIEKWKNGKMPLHKLIGEQNEPAYSYFKGVEDARRRGRISIAGTLAQDKRRYYQSGFNLVHDKHTFTLKFKHGVEKLVIDGSKFKPEELAKELYAKSEKGATFVQARSHVGNFNKKIAFGSIALFLHGINNLFAATTDIGNTWEDPHRDFCKKSCDGRGIHIKGSAAGLAEIFNYQISDDIKKKPSLSTEPAKTAE